MSDGHQCSFLAGRLTGSCRSITVQKAEGDLTAAGDAQGTATIVQFGQLIEAEFVLVDGQLYLKGPTGGFSQVPAALAGSVYDPSAILNPDKGVAKVLSLGHQSDHHRHRRACLGGHRYRAGRRCRRSGARAEQ